MLVAPVVAIVAIFELSKLLLVLEAFNVVGGALIVAPVKNKNLFKTHLPIAA